MSFNDSMVILAENRVEWMETWFDGQRAIFIVSHPKGPCMALDAAQLVRLVAVVLENPTTWGRCPRCTRRYDTEDEGNALEMVVLDRQPCHRCRLVPGSDEAMWGMHGSPEEYFNDRAERMFGRNWL